ncbi:glycoside hydrolase superfamily [Lipomyces japonicus]|uniref:glycoside hydrolase superfamily n=1 Tax=Lipomyces japonicus TaxID=56871 RepID=UPI0034CD708F
MVNQGFSSSPISSVCDPTWEQDSIEQLHPHARDAYNSPAWEDSTFGKSPRPAPLPPSFSEKPTTNHNRWRTRNIILAVVAVIVIVLVAVLVPVGVVVIGKSNSLSNSSSSSFPSSWPASPQPSSESGGDNGSGSNDNGTPSYAVNTTLDIATWLDLTDFNTTFTNETVGGLPIMGLNSTWDDSVQANNKVAPLNQNFNYSETPMRGVNLGGWLILEPFITPSFFENYAQSEGVVDEYTLSQKLVNDSSMEELKQVIETHYSTFITEQTFKDIRDVGLDHVRIPYAYWAIRKLDGEPYLEKVQWRYLLRAIEWARKYGLRVNLDLHSVPGNANGWNHSGRQGQLQWLNGTDGDYYGALTLDLHRQLATFFSQERYKNVVTMYGLVNEPNMLLLDNLRVINWTSVAYDTVRENGFEQYIVFGDGFRGAASWQGVFNQTRYPKFVLDLHQYMIFNKDLLMQTHSGKINFICNSWTNQMMVSSDPATGHGPTIVGEWSQADTDCLRYLNNVGVGSRWEGTFNVSSVQDQVLTQSCPAGTNCTCAPTSVDPAEYNDEYKQYLLMSAESQMYAFESNGGYGFMYWTWKTETADATQWSFQRGVQADIIPQLAYNRTYDCSATGTPDFIALGLSDNF